MRTTKDSRLEKNTYDVKYPQDSIKQHFWLVCNTVYQSLVVMNEIHCWKDETFFHDDGYV